MGEDFKFKIEDLDLKFTEKRPAGEGRSFGYYQL